MKQLLSLAALGMALALGSAHAAEEKAPTKQQTKMATCNKEATGMKGDERKAFMKNCLSNKPEAAATQQTNMKTCNAEAAGKKGAERKTFMSECLKK